MEAFGKFCLFVLAMIISIIVSGFAFCKLWLWFVVPIFGLPVLTLVQAAGIINIVGYITYRKEQKDERDPSVVMYEAFIWSMAKAILYLIVGFFLHLMM
jgi:multisubunit Na+/H+ antiporter MnhB subunit